jgi:hypothetical protein
LDLIVRPKEEEFKDDGLSLTIKYLWKLKLPKLPKDAQKDPLYKEWEQVSGIDKPESADLEKNLQSLPNVGTLFTKAGKRYLQIQFWEELLEAQREAKRFNNADIVI